MPKKFDQIQRDHVLLRILIMIKAKDDLFFAIDEFYLNLVIDGHLARHTKDEYGIEITEDGERYIKKHTDSILPGTY